MTTRLTSPVLTRRHLTHHRLAALQALAQAVRLEREREQAEAAAFWAGGVYRRGRA